MTINGEAQQCSTAQSGVPIDVSKTNDGGVMKTILKSGVSSAHPKTGDTVFVHYVGTLTDGTKFDSSRDRGEQFSFTLGRGQVISAWDSAVASMIKGEIARVQCGAKYAYAEAGSPPKIPPNADLIFEIELISWEGEDISPDKDKSITRSVQKEGEKHETPNDGAKVECHLTGYHDERKFVDADFEFVVGECVEHGLPEGIDKAVRKFKKGERSSIQLAPKWGYGKAGSTTYSIPPMAGLDFEIEMKSFEKAKESWQMDTDEKIAECEKLKARGTEFFQKGKNKLAASKYKRIADILQYENTLEGEQKAKRDALYRAAHLNLALVFLKGGENVEAVKHCDKVLDEEKSNVKALYRRAEAYQNQNDFDQAVLDYEHVLKLEPDNKAAKNQIIVCKKKMLEVTQQQKKLYANMFERLAKKTDEKDQKANPKEENFDQKCKGEELEINGKLDAEMKTSEA